MPSARTPLTMAMHAVEGLAVFHLAPGRAHAEARGARLLGALGLCEHVIDIEQRLALEPGGLGVVGRLRAIFAVLGAGAGLDREQACELHLAIFVVAPVHGARRIDEVEQGLAKEIEDFPAAPIVAGLGRALALRANSLFGGLCR